MDYRADFYSLGSIFYHLLSGRPLFGEYVRGGVVTTESALEIAAAHRAQVPFPPTAGRHSLLDQLVLQLLQKAPDLRYQTGISPLIRLTFKLKGSSMICGLSAKEKLPPIL